MTDAERMKDQIDYMQRENNRLTLENDQLYRKCYGMEQTLGIIQNIININSNGQRERESMQLPVPQRFGWTCPPFGSSAVDAALPLAALPLGSPPFGSTCSRAKKE